MKDEFKAFFSLSSRERTGVLSLIVIILLITIIKPFVSMHRPAMGRKNDTLVLKELADFEQQLVFNREAANEELTGLDEVETIKPEWFSFDPNKASAGDLRKLGIPTRLIRTWISYRNHGGRFYRKEDLKKIYGMSQDLYEKLAPYVSMSDTMNRVSRKKEDVHIEEVRIDINRADPELLEMLPGIGPVLSKRIVRYRDLLGGFYDPGQLVEVFGLSDSLVSGIKNRVYADTSAIVKLDVNKAGEFEMARHPYIGKYNARGIIKYRDSTGKINNIIELKINGLLSDEVFEKIKKYLAV